MHGRLLVLYPAYLHVVGFFARVKFNVYYFVYEEFKLINFLKMIDYGQNYVLLIFLNIFFTYIFVRSTEI